MKTFKKILILPAFLLSTAAFADGAPYVGASIGGINGNGDNSSTQISVTGGVFGGYGYTFAQHYYLAAEAFGNLNKNTSNFGLSLIPGFKFNDQFMLYGRVGEVYVKGNNFGTQLGGGAQVNFTKNLGLRGEYDYIKYPTWLSGSANLGPGIGTINFGPSSTHTQQVNLGLVYTFK